MCRGVKRTALHTHTHTHTHTHGQTAGAEKGGAVLVQLGLEAHWASHLP